MQIKHEVQNLTRHRSFDCLDEWLEGEETRRKEHSHTHTAAGVIKGPQNSLKTQNTLKMRRLSFPSLDHDKTEKERIKGKLQKFDLTANIAFLRSIAEEK